MTELSNESRRDWRDWIALTIAALFPVLAFGRGLSHGVVLCPDDCVIQNLPFRVLVAKMLHDGQLPLWNPFMFSGMPLFAAIQAGILLPAHLLFLVLPPAIAMNGTMLIAYATASVGGYLYGRSVGMTRGGALLTGVAWQSSGFLIGQIGHTNIVQTAAHIPWILWAVERYATSGRRRWAVAVSIAVMMEAFAGHPQTFIFSLLLATAYCATLGWFVPTQRARYFSGVALLVAGVALAAVQLLPTAELAGLSIRSDATYDFFKSFSYARGMLRTFFAPFALGGGDGRIFRAPYIGPPYFGEMVGYVGLLPLWLAVVAVLRVRDVRVRFWAATVAIAPILALNGNLPFEMSRFLYLIPVLNKFRASARHLMEMNFALAALAGFGLSWFSRLPRSRFAPAAVVTGTLGTLATILMATVFRKAEFRLARPVPVTLLRAPELFIPIVLAIAATWLLIRFQQQRRYAGVLIALLIGFDLILWSDSSGWRFSPHADDALYGTPEAVTWMQERQKKEPLFRVLSVRAPLDPTVTAATASQQMTEFLLSTQPDIYMMHRVQNAAGYEAFGLQRYSRLAGDMKVWGDLDNPPATLGPGRELDVLNVKYMIAPATSRSAAQGDGRWAHIVDLHGIAVYENRQALPRAWVTTDTAVMDESAILQVLRGAPLASGRAWDPRRTALIEQALPTEVDAFELPTRAEVVHYEPMRVEITAGTPRPGVLVLADNFYPGWYATIDGRRTDLFRVNYNLRGVVLPPGSHSVVFTYRPWSVIGGAAVSGVTAIGMVAWIGVPRFRRRRSA